MDSVVILIVVILSVLKGSRDALAYILRCFLTGTSPIIHQYQWYSPEGLSHIEHQQTTTTHSKAQTVCIMMTSPNVKNIRVTGPLCGEFIGHRWIPLIKASGAELCFFSLICAHYDVTVIRFLGYTVRVQGDRVKAKTCVPFPEFFGINSVHQDWYQLIRIALHVFLLPLNQPTAT